MIYIFPEKQCSQIYQVLPAQLWWLIHAKSQFLLVLIVIFQPGSSCVQHSTDLSAFEINLAMGQYL